MKLKALPLIALSVFTLSGCTNSCGSKPAEAPVDSAAPIAPDTTTPAPTTPAPGDANTPAANAPAATPAPTTPAPGDANTPAPATPSDSTTAAPAK